MIPSFWRRWPLTKAAKKDAWDTVPREVETLQRYLEVARKCADHAKRMTSSSASRAVQFNYGQCAHLAREVEVAVQMAEACSALLFSPEVMLSSVGITKLLCRCAMEVEAFIQSCHQDKWVQAALLLWNASKYVSSLSSDLVFCMILLRKHPMDAKTWRDLALEVAGLDVFDESESVNEIVMSDQMALLRRLEAMNESRNSSDEEHELAKYLSGRLTQHLTGHAVLNVWEVDISSLRALERLGCGSDGRVHKSMWLGVEVAEKRFDGTDRRSFRNEVGILAGLVHPNIVPLLGYAMDESRCSIVMELMDGDLSFLMEERLRQNSWSRFPFTTSEAVDMMLQTAEGMCYIHANKVVHMNLNSHNILVKSRNDSDGEYIYAKVGDFGLSERKERSISCEPLTLNTGTTRWMAPELIPQGEHDPQARTELRYPFKVDVFSFGMVCYEILTGKVPFSAISSARKIKRMVLNGIRPELPDECLPDLKTLIHACWKSDARDRPSFVEICMRLRGMKYLLMRGVDVETIHDNSEVAKVQDKVLPVKEKPNDGGFVEEELASRTKLLEKMTDDEELTKEELVATRTGGISEMLHLQKQDASSQFLKILQDVYEPKSAQEFQDILENEISHLSYLLELRTENDQGQDFLSEYDKIMILFHFNEKDEEDYMFEFFFKNYEGMACIVDVGLEYAKVILEDGWQVKVIEISKEDYDNVWENIDSTSSSLLLFTMPQSSIQRGRFLLVDIAKYFILRKTYVVFPSNIVSYNTSHNGGASSSHSSMNKSNSSFSKTNSVKTIENIFNLKEASRKLGTENDIGNRENDPNDTPNKDNEFTVTLELLRGGNVDGDGNGASDSAATVLMKEQLKETIWTKMKFKFIDHEVSGKEIQVSVGPTTFAFNEANIENVKRRGLFGWYHRFLDVKFAPKNKDHAKIESGFKHRSLDVTEGKVSDKIISSVEVSNDRTFEVGPSASAMLHAGIATAGLVVPAKYSNRKGSKAIKIVDGGREHVVGHTDDGFSVNGTFYPDVEKVHYTYESLDEPDLSPTELRDQGDYDDHWRHQYIFPFCRAQRVGFEAAWIPHDPSEENNARQLHPFVEYVFEASRQVEFKTVLTGPTTKGKGKLLQDNGSEEGRFKQVYEKRIWLNHAMMNLAPERSFDVLEDQTLRTLLKDKKTRRAPRWGNPGPLALGSAAQIERNYLFHT